MSRLINGLFYEGLQTADPTTVALILALTPVMTSILAVFILNEPLTAKLVIGGGIATFGVFFVIGVGQRFVFSEGLIWIFITMLSFFFIYRFNSEIGEQR